MNPLLLIVEIAGEKVALRVDDIESVAELELLTPVPRSPAHVAGLSTLRSRVLTVIDCQCALGLGHSGQRQAGASAAIAVHDGHAYALLLDNVEDVAQALSDPTPAGARHGGNWEGMSHGIVETKEGPLLLLDVAALIEGIPETRAA
ncbi:chemotaxis protein CheW [Novosphingobium album (ex Hu et al. 2023)]|uniref:Chemotaxis protein CheW n=1 Tax=Novosphingobium album (ex Hu et al. 2023) TaxID=2930093 RepID=A0ABT0B470_9SPHN|nr:chemotaxis protein CheW [Novosphingobium album (ex Hu et al. 2023)]MCJ2179673.1 chemotaxis protein CheW [Novosphingobium album (ex Hu et al. 2023)]